MRLLTTNLLAVALLLFGAASASAFATNMVTSYDGTQGVSDSFTVTVNYDTEGATGTMLLSVGVIFDSTYLAYMGNVSQSYMLYTPAAGMTQPSNWLSPAPSNGTIWTGSSPAPPLQKVNLDWIADKFPNYGTFIDSASDGYSDALGTLTFHIVAAGTSTVDIQTSGDGNVLQLGDTSIVPNAGSGAFVVTPEPSTALLIGLGLVGLGVAGRKD